jgi:hypothetical protein
MTRELSELEQRRDALRRSLPGLSDTRALSYRRNNDARALDHAGVKHQRPEEMARLAQAELAADEAIRDVQRELRQIDAEIERAPRGGFGATLRRAVRRGRNDP